MSNWVKVDGPKPQKWTPLVRVDGPKRHKVDGLRKCTVQKRNWVVLRKVVKKDEWTLPELVHFFPDSK